MKQSLAFSCRLNAKSVRQQGNINPSTMSSRVVADSIKNSEDPEMLLSACIPREFAFHEDTELVSACISRLLDGHTIL